MKASISWLIMGFVVFAICFGITYKGHIQLPSVSIQIDRLNSEPVSPRAIKDGVELTLIYIGSSSCAAAKTREIPEVVNALIATVEEKASNQNFSFSSLGISIDSSVDEGFKHLKSVGDFDEVMTGRHWLNTGSLKYIWQDITGRASTPQILVVARNVVAENGKYEIQSEQFLIRKIGVLEMTNWLHSGAPMPVLQSKGDQVR